MIRALQNLMMVTVGMSVIAPITALAQTQGETIFAMTNAADKNEVIAFHGNSRGDFSEGEHYATHGRGTGGITDPLSSQGSLTLSTDHSFLFVANAGSGTISVFRVLRSSLIFVDQVPSGGGEPIAIAQFGNFVYVVNTAGNGAVVGFRLGPDGRLQQIQNSLQFLSSTGTGGSSISVSPNGQFLSVIERIPNNIDTFRIQSDGTLSPIVVNHGSDPGVFAGAFAPDGSLIVVETGPASSTNGSTISSYNVSANGTISPVTPTLPTLGSVNCWDAITPNGKFVYASNSGSGTISGFSIGKGGALTPIESTTVATLPDGSTNLDITISGDGKYLFTLNSGTGTIGVFAIQNDGSLESFGEIPGLPKSAGVNGIAAL